MRKNIFIFNLILIMLITLNCNMAYAEPNEGVEQNEEMKHEPYKTLEELKKELKEERRQIDQQRLEEIRKKEEEKKEELGKTKNEEKNDENENEKNENKKSKENEYIPSLIVRLRGKHSAKY